MSFGSASVSVARRVSGLLVRVVALSDPMLRTRDRTGSFPDLLALSQELEQEHEHVDEIQVQ